MVAIAAFVTLAFVGFSAFTSSPDNVTVVGNKKVFGVFVYEGYGALDKPTLQKWFSTREAAETYAKQEADNDIVRDGDDPNAFPFIFSIVEGYVNETRSSAIPPDFRNW